MRSATILLVFLFAPLLFADEGLAQRRSGSEGVLRLANWPESSLKKSGLSDRHVDRALGQYDLLPYVDTLTVGYRYETAGEQPEVTLAIEWKPDQFGILDGRKVAFEQMPDSLLLTSLTFQADVFSKGEKVTEAVIRIDSLALAASPDVVRLDPAMLQWNSVFEHTPPKAAQRIFEDGFELRNLDILTASFESFDAREEEHIAGTYRKSRRTSSRRTVYDGHTVADVLIDLGWLFWPRGWDRDYDDNERGRPRGDDIGRGDSDDDHPRGSRRGNGDSDTGASEDTQRSRPNRDTSAESSDGGTSSSDAPSRAPRGRKEKSSTGGSDSSSDDSDDEDDENKLLPAALTAAAAVGILAYQGGTIGYFGNAKYAPYGIAAGMVRSKGGFMLQAGVNDAVLGSGDGPERFIGKVLAFREVLPVPIQPAIGAGVLVSYEDESYSYEPSFSVGALGNFGPVILLGAYDVALDGMELGVAFNFRSRPRHASLP